ncbi:MAG: cytochrome c3 family protein [Candidatus Eisenbacteria bacterium]|nr:cytochrome c3 family protein [Candidatus Eisenbacteria bacterium]
MQRKKRGRAFLSFLGIDTPEDRRFHIHLRPRFFKWLAGIGILIVLATAGLIEYSTSPRFCDSCHIMKPYYYAWKTSGHNKVACVKCHYPPDRKGAIWLKFQASAQVVKYITRTYNPKPYAEIQDASCLRSGCHSKRLLEGKVTFKKGIVFDHKPHLLHLQRGKKLRCTSCHSQIVIGTHIEVTETTCFLCHFKGERKGRELEPIGGCPSCHEPSEKVFTIGEATYKHKDFVKRPGVRCQDCHLDIVQGDGNAPRERCFACHNEPERLAKYDDITFIHDNHITKHGIECTQCHLEVKHEVKTAREPLEYDCSVCHVGEHGGHGKMYRGVGGKGVPSMPDLMYLTGVDCTACHDLKMVPGKAAHFKGQTFVPSRAGCVKCHGESYGSLLSVWKNSTQEALARLNPKLSETRAQLARGKKASPAIQKLIDDAEYNIRFVSLAKGAHNIYYAARLLEVADDWLDQARGKLALEPNSLKGNRILNGTYCATLCHSGIGVKTPDEVVFQGERLPHADHGSKWNVPCAGCHAVENHRQLRKDMTKGDCMACHHKQKDADCTKCHQETASFIQGPPPSSMAGLGCTDCHELSERHSMGKVASKCESCHSKDYRDILKDWNGEIEANRNALGKLIESCEKRRLNRDSLSILNEAKKDYAMVSKVKGVHNPEFALKLLGDAKDRLWGLAGQAVKH